MALPAAFTAIALAGFTYLMRRNRVQLVDPIFEGGTVVGATTHTAVPTMAEIADENAQAAVAAAAMGANIANVVDQLRTQNEQFQRQLQEQQQNFERQLAAERRIQERRDRENDRLRTRPPELKVEPPEHYEGEPAEIDAWIRRMNYYFTQVRLTDDIDRVTYAIQRIRKGKGNRATNWANGKIGEIAQFDEELTQFRITYPGRPCTNTQAKAIVPAEPAGDGHPDGWPEYIFTHKPPFATWAEFCEEARQYFLTTETRDEAVKKLRELKQGEKTIEEFIIEFKGWAQLSGFDDIALVDQFKRGVKTALGRRVIELGNPGDGSITGQLQAWYTRATEIEKQFREAEKYYGKREFKVTRTNAQAGPSQPKKETITVKVKDENAMDVDSAPTTRPPPKCYNCGKMGHIAKYCRGKTQVRKVAVGDYLATMTDEEKSEMKEKLGFGKDQ